MSRKFNKIFVITATLMVAIFAFVSCTKGPSTRSAEVTPASEVVTEKTAEEPVFFGDEETKDEFEDLDTRADDITRSKLFVEPKDRLGSKPLRLTLEDCIRIALVNNAKVQSTEYSIDSAEAKYNEANLAGYPIFEYEWMSAPVPRDANRALGSFFKGDVTWWNKLRVVMGIPLYSFGKIGLLKDLAKGGILAAREERKKEKISVVTRVRQLYYGILLAEEIGRLLKHAHEKLSDAIDKKNEDGTDKSPIEKVKAKVFLLDLEKRLADARDKEMIALEGLRVQLGLNPDVAIMVYSDKLKPADANLRPLDDYLEMAMKNRPDVKMIEIGLETRRNQYRLEKRNFFPDVGFGAYVDLGATITDVRNITATDAFQNPFNFKRSGLGMQVKGKFDPHGQWARTKKAKSDYYKASMEHYMAKDGISLEVKKSYLDVRTAYDQMRRAEQAQRYARQLMFMTQSNYEIGVGEQEEYTSALELVLLTRGKYFESIFSYNITLAVLDEVSGVIPDAQEIYGSNIEARAAEYGEQIKQTNFEDKININPIRANIKEESGVKTEEQE